MVIELTPQLVEKIEKTHDSVTRIETILGNGSGGIRADIKNQGRRISRLELILVGIFSSGILGSGIYGLVELFK